LLIAAAGSQDVAQEFSLRVQRSRDLTLDIDRLELKSQFQGLLRALREDPGIEDRSDHVEFLLAWWPRHASHPVALHLLSAGAAEWVEGWMFAGLPLGTEIASFATSTMRYLDPAELTLEQAKLLALKVLRDAIETGVEGIGGGVQMGAVAKHGAGVIEATDMTWLHYAADAWEKRCAELLRGTVPADRRSRRARWLVPRP
jgi:hypothetical protein